MNALVPLQGRAQVDQFGRTLNAVQMTQTCGNDLGEQPLTSKCLVHGALQLEQARHKKTRPAIALGFGPAMVGLRKKEEGVSPGLGMCDRLEQSHRRHQLATSHSVTGREGPANCCVGSDGWEESHAAIVRERTWQRDQVRLGTLAVRPETKNPIELTRWGSLKNLTRRFATSRKEVTCGRS